MHTELPDDVPSRIDLRRMEDAREWADAAMVKRPWRIELFERIASELLTAGFATPSILELGSGPGFLAHHLLTTIPAATYVALDFSPAMHALARERLGDLAARVRFVEADFRDPAWHEGLGLFDAVVTVQAVHELRHKRHAPTFYRGVKSHLRPGSLFLVCDHFVAPDGMSDAALYMTPEEHEVALRQAGFVCARLVQQGGLVLYLSQVSSSADAEEKTP